MAIHSSSVLRGRTQVATTAEVREFATITDSFVATHAKVYERVSLKRVEVGARSEINAGTYIEQATIGDDVQIGPNCSIVGVWHPIEKEGASKEDILRRVTIEDGVLIGAGATVLPGVTLGEGAVIGAGSTVTKDVPPRHLLYGSPGSQVLMPLTEYVKKKEG